MDEKSQDVDRELQSPVNRFKELWPVVSNVFCKFSTSNVITICNKENRKS